MRSVVATRRQFLTAGGVALAGAVLTFRSGSRHASHGSRSAPGSRGTACRSATHTPSIRWRWSFGWSRDWTKPSSVP